MRDLLIGTTVVLADGTVARAGGKVVKNVAGYDLGKLYTGAHGSLGVVVSTTWRLQPVPPARRVVTLELTAAAYAGPLAAALNRSTLTPSAVELVGTAGGGPANLVVLFESIAESVADQARSAVSLLGGGTQSDDLPPEFGRRPGSADDVLLRLAFVPAALSSVLAALPAGTAVRASAGTSVAYGAVPAAQAAGAAAGLPGRARPARRHSRRPAGTRRPPGPAGPLGSGRRLAGPDAAGQGEVRPRAAHVAGPVRRRSVAP